MGARPAPFTHAARRVRDQRAFFAAGAKPSRRLTSSFYGAIPGKYADPVRAGFGRGVAKGICGIAISFFIESFISVVSCNLFGNRQPFYLLGKFLCRYLLLRN